MVKIVVYVISLHTEINQYYISNSIVNFVKLTVKTLIIHTYFIVQIPNKTILCLKKLMFSCYINQAIMYIAAPNEFT